MESNKLVNQHNIERLVAEWHRSDSAQEVHEYLGISKEEYFRLIEQGKIIQNKK